MREIGAGLAGALILFFARFITAVRGRWDGVAPTGEQRVYFANHASHGDFVLIWTVLPRRMRFATRPVAGSDYWLKSSLRRFIGRDVFKVQDSQRLGIHGRWVPRWGRGCHMLGADEASGVPQR